MGLGIPNWSDVRNAVSSAAATATNTISSTAAKVRDLGAAALDRTSELARDGVDLGRRAVDAVRSVDVREAASVVREKIGAATETAREGIRTGVEWSGQRTHEAAEFARDHVPGGDNVVSNAVRGAITAQENSTRFSLGVIGGVSREVVGLAGTVGTLGTTAVEMQLSPAARVDYGQQIVDGARGAAESGGDYIASVARDPSRLGDDISGAAGAAKDWAGGQIDRYEAAFRNGKGFETVGMDVGTVATYVVPVGGGPARGALTAAAREGAEAAAREGAEALARGGLETLDTVGGIARRTGASEARLQEVIDLGRGNRPAPAEYLSAERIGEHRAAFDDGASRFSLAANVDKYGLGQRDGTTFVMSHSEADAILRATGGDARKLEDALGLPAGQLDGDALVRVDFAPAALDDLGLRMPSGNEAGANAQWLPGGYLPSGANEAVLDGARATAEQYSISTVK